MHPSKQEHERPYYFSHDGYGDDPRRWQAQVNARERDECARHLRAAQSIAQNAINAVKAKKQELLGELKARLERQAWSGISKDDRAALQQHFRRQHDHSVLYEGLQDRVKAAVEVGMKDAQGVLSVAELQLRVNELSAHAHVRAGERCPECSSQLREKVRYFDNGKFIGCSQFPECTYAWGVELGHTRKHQPPEDEKVNATVTTAAREDALTALSQELARLFNTSTAARICMRAGLQQTLTTPWDSSTGMVQLWSTLLTNAEKEGQHEQLWLAIADAVDDMFRRSIAYKQLQLLEPLWQACKFTSPHSGAGTTTVPEATVTKEEVKTTMAESTKTQAAPSIGGMASMLFEMTKDDMGDAVWRTAADETVETLKAPAKIALRKAQRTAVGKPIAAFALKAIDHPLGEGIFAQCCGMGLVAYGPLRGNTLGPKTARLSKELRVKGWKPFTDLFAKTIIAPVRETIVKLIESLPDQPS